MGCALLHVATTRVSKGCSSACWAFRNRFWPWRYLWWLGLVVALGFAAKSWMQGPNHFAWRTVKVQDITVFTTTTTQGSWRSWQFEYSREDPLGGARITGQVQVQERDLDSRIKHTSPEQWVGRDVRLYVPVSPHEPGADFAYNRGLRQGLLLATMLLVLRWHLRRNDDPLSKMAMLELVLVMGIVVYWWVFAVPRGAV